jgi:hypothetical protein
VSLPTSDPRKLMRMSEPERAMIAAALESHVAYGPALTDDERELAATIIGRMTT